MPLDVYLCQDCGHVQLLDLVDPRLQYNAYRYRTSVSVGLRRHFESLVRYVLERLALPAGSLVVEIGSNEGTVLRAFQAAGMRVLGVDPAVEIARAATDSGVETIPDFFSSDLARRVLARSGPAHVVVANNVVANVEDLHDLLDGVRTLLGDAGVFVFETLYAVDVFERRLLDTLFHEHIAYFNLGPLDVLLKRHGFELVEARRIESKGGSIRVIAQAAGGRLTRDALLAETIADEVRLGYRDGRSFTSFNEHLGRVRRDVAEAVGSADLLAGLGGSVGALTQIHYFGFQERLAFIADDAPLQPALVGPGYRVPLLPMSAIDEQRPQAVVVFAWRYLEGILPRLKDYMDRGGRLIVPLPECRVLG